MDFHWHAYSVKKITNAVHRNVEEFLFCLKGEALRKNGPKSVKYDSPVAALKHI